MLSVVCTQIGVMMTYHIFQLLDAGSILTFVPMVTKIEVLDPGIKNLDYYLIEQQSS